MREIFDDLVIFTSADLDRHGEAHINCPTCGHSSSPRDPHCSFSQRGWKCFSCGEGGSLSKLAELIGLEQREYAPAKPMPKKQAAPATWLSQAERLVERYECHPERLALWQGYKPVSYANIINHRLGVGVLPSSKCQHERLIVPIIDGSMIVGLRGRALSCDCGKWLAPGGTQISLYPLYNEPALQPGCVAWIVENPIDALLVSQSTPYVGLATYSVAYWVERWTAVIAASQPALVVVAYDNDLSGNGGAQRRGDLLRAWKIKHPDPKLKPPDAAGPKLTNRLIDGRLNAALFDWGKLPNKDIGTLLQTASI